MEASYLWEEPFRCQIVVLFEIRIDEQYESSTRGMTIMYQFPAKYHLVSRKIMR